jgi:hypothetical protein
MRERTDSVATFPLRGATNDELGIALALCHYDFFLWHAQALTIAQFPVQAQVAGVHDILAAEKLHALQYAMSKGMLKVDVSKMTLTTEELASQMARKQFETIEHSTRIAAVVMLHSACERFFWRLVRLAMVAQRSKAVECIEQRKLLLRELTCDKDSLIDDHLERWWWELERKSILDKWDALVRLVGSPEKLREGSWYFDREMLEEFDKVRHDCVHHTGSGLKTFDLQQFAGQLLGAQLEWMVTLAMSLNVKIPAELAFTGVPTQGQ